MGFKMEFYFDMETTGLDYDKDETITIQWQRLGYAGEPIGKLNILKRWESSEKEILENFLPPITSHIPSLFTTTTNTTPHNTKKLFLDIRYIEKGV